MQLTKRQENIISSVLIFVITSLVAFFFNFFFIKYPEVEAQIKVLEEKYQNIDRQLKEIHADQEELMYYLMGKTNSRGNK